MPLTFNDLSTAGLIQQSADADDVTSGVALRVMKVVVHADSTAGGAVVTAYNNTVSNGTNITIGVDALGTAVLDLAPNGIRYTALSLFHSANVTFGAVFYILETP